MRITQLALKHAETHKDQTKAADAAWTALADELEDMVTHGVEANPDNPRVRGFESLAAHPS